MNFSIDERIRSHIPPLRADELRQLEENLLTEGCRYPLIIWNGLLLDGHNRYDICTRHNISFETEEVELPDFDAAIDWIEDNQLGRRNLTADQFAYFVGRKYERTKRARNDGGFGTPKATEDQNDPRLSTAEKIAADHGISAPTVKRAAEFSRDVDAISDVLGDSARSEILSGDTSATRADVHEVAEAVKDAATPLQFSNAKEAFDWVKEQRAVKAEQRREERIEKIAEISRGNRELGTDQRYPVIYADPPWRYENPPIGATSRAIENHYPTMTLEEICALPVGDIAADDAILYMWATAPKLAECMKVIEAWGFEYRTNAVWDKEVIGMGYHFRNQHEILLVAKRGSLPPPLAGTQPSSVYRERRGEHSAKPDYYYEIIESFYPTLPKIELFCRSPRENWSVWGNQSAEAA